MKEFTILLAIGLILITKFANSQTFSNYTTASTSTKLCDHLVIAIEVDPAGNKWFGTSEGISKYDGTIWTTYTTADGLAGNCVTAIAIDAQGNKWFGTDNGVSKLSAEGSQGIKPVANNEFSC